MPQDAPETFETFVARERQRLTKEREDIAAKQQELEQRLDALNRELAAIQAYEDAKRGKATNRASASGRRSGIRKQVLETIKATPEGMTRREVLDALSATDKTAEQSVSNALSALKRQGQLKQEGIKYLAA